MNIGPKIKELRVMKGLTQEELADRSELSKGFISQLERDLTSPSIATLVDILNSLGTNLKEFFSDDSDEQIVFHDADYCEKYDAELKNKIEWIIPNAQKNAMEPILLTLPPHGRSQTMTSYNGEEFGYVLKGVVDLVIENKRYRVKAKETFYVDGSRSHTLVNPGAKEAQVLWITTPPMF